jgi:hypothetical protein
LIMRDSSPHVPGLFPAPCRDITLNAISRAILRIRSNGVKAKDLAKKLDVSTDILTSAAAEESMLNFTAIARMAFFYPDEWASLVEPLWTCIPPEPVTLADRLDRIDREVVAMRRVA